MTQNNLPSSGISRVVQGLEAINQFIGQTIAWATLLMVLMTFMVVVMRYAFSMTFIAIDESVVYLHALVFLLGAAYTLQKDEHVRVDVFYRGFSLKTRVWIDFIGTLVFLIPVCVYIFVMSYDYVSLSWRISETSTEAGGLPLVYLLKSLLLVMPALMLIQGLAWLLSQANFLFFKGPAPKLHNPDPLLKNEAEI